jgi:hypothetical protein
MKAIPQNCSTKLDCPPRFASLALIVMTAVALSAAAQTPQPTVDSNVRPASVDRSAPAPPAPAARFARRPTQAGDQVEQVIAHEMQLTTNWRQGNEIVDSSTTVVKNNQRRLVTTTHIAEGRTHGVIVRYLEATNQQSSGEKPAETQPPSTSPVMGKTYRCQRDGEKFVVTDEQGRLPPPVELEIVTADMESVGRPSPLAEFLAGRTVAIGETLSLPLELADRLLGLSDTLGKLTRFDLTLREVRTDEGVPIALFHASIEAASNDSSQLRLIVSGPLVVQTETCRAVSTNLSGPIAMSESRGSYSARFQLISTGRLSMNIASTYRDATR